MLINIYYDTQTISNSDLSNAQRIIMFKIYNIKMFECLLVRIYFRTSQSLNVYKCNIHF